MPTAFEAERFRELELVQAARLLAALGHDKQTPSFILRLEATSATPGERELVAVLANDISRPDLSVRVAKKAAQRGITMPTRAYPLPDVDGGPLETALVLSVTRQESLFNPQAISPAGARGLMQLLPVTASKVAKGLKISYSRARLLSDPDYNVRLGSAHLDELIRKFDGSFAMAVAAYNAGERRVKSWIRDNGDPRKGEVDEIDWIEMIPFDETRNYVQRVLENLVVYRERLAPLPPPPPPALRAAIEPGQTPIRLRVGLERLYE